jgi:hypothetical protein
MSYAETNPPVCIMPSFNGTTPSIWSYRSTDPAASVDADGYITNAQELGMRAGDIVYVEDTDASPVVLTSHRVAAINADGSADLSDGATLASTNSD